MSVTSEDRRRISGIAARERDGTCRENQPCPSSSAIEARDALVGVLGGPRGWNRTGHIAVSGPRLACRSEGSAGGKTGCPLRDQALITLPRGLFSNLCAFRSF